MGRQDEQPIDVGDYAGVTRYCIIYGSMWIRQPSLMFDCGCVVLTLTHACYRCSLPYGVVFI